MYIVLYKNKYFKGNFKKMVMVYNECLSEKSLREKRKIKLRVNFSRL